MHSEAPSQIVLKTTIDEDREVESKSSDTSETFGNSEMNNHSTMVQNRFVYLLTAMVRIKYEGGSILAKALVNQCSQSSIISDSLWNSLKLKRSSGRVNINGVGDQSP